MRSELSSIRGVRNGTPVGNDSLCSTCRYAHIQRGYAASEERAFCRYGDYRPVPFRVRECTEYEDRRLPSLYDMERTAWILLTKKAGNPAGFVTPKRFRELEGDDADVLP